MTPFLDFFRRNKQVQSDLGQLSEPEKGIHALLATQDFDSLLRLITPVVVERIKYLSSEEKGALEAIGRAWGLQTIHYHLFVAFLRGFRSGEEGARLSSADSEVSNELRFLTHNTQIDIALSCSRRINDYFCDAVWLFIKTDTPAARLAALTAGAIAQDDQRKSLIGYISDVAGDWRSRSPSTKSVADKLDALAAEISGTEWTLQDTIDLKSQLRSIEPEFFFCLAAPDPTVFRSRYPEIFAEHDLWFS